MPVSGHERFEESADLGSCGCDLSVRVDRRVKGPDGHIRAAGNLTRALASTPRTPPRDMRQRMRAIANSTAERHSADWRCAGTHPLISP
jgi:hypothetical protein